MFAIKMAPYLGLRQGTLDSQGNSTTLNQQPLNFTEQTAPKTKPDRSMTTSLTDDRQRTSCANLPTGREMTELVPILSPSLP